MRGTVAKRIRKVVYGADMSPRERKYLKGREPMSSKTYRNPTCICDGLRRKYKILKFGWTSNAPGVRRAITQITRGVEDGRV